MAASPQMPQDQSDWFSLCFGFSAVFVYLGSRSRPVLFPFSPSPSRSYSLLGYLSSGFLGTPIRDEKITFADCAPYLVVSETSLHEVSKRLLVDDPLDVRKFRPNIVVSGAPTVWEEDF